MGMIRLIPLPLLLVSACGLGSNPAAEIEESSYQVTGISVDGQVIDVGRSAAMFSISDGQIMGNNGCNQFGGSIVADADGDLLVDQVSQTLMACPDTEAVETGFNAVLDRADRWVWDGTTLTFSSTDGSVTLTATRLHVEASG